MTQADDELGKVSNELKTLEILRRKKLKHRENIGKSMAEVDKEISEIVAKIEAIKHRIKEPIVTEHAILRYIQRVEGRSLDEIIKSILPPDIAKRVKVLGSGVYPVGDFKIRVKDGIVVTVFKGDEDNEKTDF